MGRHERVDPLLGCTDELALNARAWNEMVVQPQNGSAASMRLPVYARVNGSDEKPEIDVVDHVDAHFIDGYGSGDVHTTILKLKAATSKRAAEHTFVLPLDVLMEKEGDETTVATVVRWRIDHLMRDIRTSQNVQRAPDEKAADSPAN